MSLILKSSPDFLSLPNEILAKICVYAVDREPVTRGKDWLLAVRHTCKLLYAPATRELAKRFLKSRIVMMSRYSLQELVALCKHDLIGPYVQQVEFYPYRLNSNFFGMIQARMDSLIIKKDYGGVPEVKRHVNWYLARVEEEMHLDRSGDAQMLLKEAFGALRRYQKPIKLITTTKHSCDVLFSHSGEKDSRLSIGEFLSFSSIAYTQGGDMTPVFGFFEAALAAGNQIHDFEVRMDTGRVGSVHPTQEGVQALSQLKRLLVDIGGSDLYSATDGTVEAIVSGAKELERVVFSSDIEYVGKPWNSTCHMSRLVKVMNSHALRQLCLRGIAIHPKGLSLMLRRHKGTLKELTISNVLLVGPWYKILLVARDELRLEKLVLINLATVNAHHFHGYFEIGDANFDLEGGIEFSGLEQVRSGVNAVFYKWDMQGTFPDYIPGWRSAKEMAHLAYPED